MCTFVGGSVHGMDYTSINVLELLGMEVSAWVFVVLCSEKPVRNNRVLLPGDNNARVYWMDRCRG